MKIVLEDSQINPLNLARKIGYGVPQYSQGNDLNFVKPIRGNAYPRFHIYLEKKGESYVINLHLDQKKPSYRGTHSHNAEYEGEVVEREAERIKNILL